MIHSTESHNIPDSAQDLESVANWLANPTAEASAHVVVDGDGNSIRMVRDLEKAWACVNYNSVSLNIEQIGSAYDGWAAWRARWRELRETARWIAQWSLRYNIPIRKGETANGVVTRSGVVTHNSLGALGGGHTDPGPYPLRRVLLLARAFKAARIAFRKKR